MLKDGWAGDSKKNDLQLTTGLKIKIGKLK